MHDSTGCQGYNHVKCNDGTWEVFEENSTACGYTEPTPEPTPEPENPITPTALGLIAAGVGAYLLLRARGGTTKNV